MRRGLITLALAVPFTVSVLVGDSAAWAGVQHSEGRCTAHHLSGCDGTDSPSWDGKHGRKLMYCGPDGTCGPVDAAAAARDTARYGDPRGNRPH